jgi:two-component system, response regulator PdtaR
LVEDEPMLRRVLCETLCGDGFVVEEAGSGDSAWALVQGGLHFDILLTDVRMPGRIDGIELARKVKDARAASHIVVMSGFTGVEIDPALGRFLAKPFSPEKLAQAITH